MIDPHQKSSQKTSVLGIFLTKIGVVFLKIRRVIPENYPMLRGRYWGEISDSCQIIEKKAVTIKILMK